MSNPNFSESELLKTLLQPLLEDFQYWFDRASYLLESERIEFLPEAQQFDLLARVRQAQQEVSVAQMLLQATEGQAGVETSVLMPWHSLVTECWQVSIRHRLAGSPNSGL